MVRRFEPTTAQRRNIEKALARMDKRRREKARKANARSAATNARRREEKLEARTAFAAKRDASRGKAAVSRRLALAGWKVLLARMDPGAWYVQGQMEKLAPEYARGTVKGWVCGPLVRDGWLERAGNPEYTGEVPWPAKTVPRYLYRCTELAAGSAAEWREALGECSDTSRHEKARQ